MVLSNCNPENIKNINGVFFLNADLKLIALGCMLSFVICIAVFRNMRLNLTHKNMICQVEIKIDARKKRINLLIDSGNFLKDPMSQKDVMIIEKNVLRDMLPESILNYQFFLLRNREFCADKEFQHHALRVIPFSSLGNPNGLIVAIKPTYVKVYYDSYEKIMKDVYIGIYDQKLDSYGRYEGLIGMNLLEKKGSNQNEFNQNFKVKFK